MNNCQTDGACHVPNNLWSFQYPRTGDAYFGTQLFSPGVGSERGYLKNRLKANLKAGKTYSVTAYVNSQHAPSASIDGIGIYVGGQELDTISNPNLALPNFVPQVQLNHIFYDTLNWIPVSGTVVASGTEKYLVFGCFKSNASVNYSITNPSSNLWAGYNVDDISCIELDINMSLNPEQNFGFIQIFPVPAQDEIQLTVESPIYFSGPTTYAIYNNLMQMVQLGEINLVNQRCNLDMSKIPEGVFTLVLSGQSTQTIKKRFVIARY